MPALTTKTTVMEASVIYISTISTNTHKIDSTERNQKTLYITLSIIITVIILLFIILVSYRMYVTKKEKYKKLILNEKLFEMNDIYKNTTTTRL